MKEKKLRNFNSNCHLEPLLLLYVSHTIGPIAMKLRENIVYTRAKTYLFINLTGGSRFLTITVT